MDFSALIPSVEVPFAPDAATSQADELDKPLSKLFAAPGQVGVSGPITTTTSGGEDPPPVPEEVARGSGAVEDWSYRSGLSSGSHL